MRGRRFTTSLLLLLLVWDYQWAMIHIHLATISNLVDLIIEKKM